MWQRWHHHEGANIARHVLWKVPSWGATLGSQVLSWSAMPRTRQCILVCVSVPQNSTWLYSVWLSLSGEPSPAVMVGARPDRDLCYKVNWCFAYKREEKDLILAFFLLLVVAFALCTCPGRFCLSKLLPGSNNLVHVQVPCSTWTNVTMFLQTEFRLIPMCHDMIYFPLLTHHHWIRSTGSDDE